MSIDVTHPPGVCGLSRRTASLPPSNTCDRGRHALGKIHAGCPHFEAGGEQVGLGGLSRVLEVTVEDSENMDLADFDRRVHAGVLLDGVGDAMFLKRNREALQGRPKIVKGAGSATNVFSYSYSFCGRAVVATFDLSAQNLEELHTDHWLCNRQNVQLLNLPTGASLH